MIIRVGVGDFSANGWFRGSNRVWEGSGTGLVLEQLYHLLKGLCQIGFHSHKAYLLHRVLRLLGLVLGSGLGKLL